MKPGALLKISAALFCAAILSSCQKTSPTSTEGTFSAGELTPYYTATASPMATATSASAATATPQPTLTATPGTYVTKDSDTLWTIAAKYGLTLAEIEAANPNVDPYNLTGGITLIIPASSSSGETQTAPTPTAVAVTLGNPECKPSLTGGLYCFALARNDQSFSVQNLVVQFILTDPDTGDKAIQEGLLPLNRLTSGTSLPLFTYFAPPVPANPQIEMQLLSALPVSEEDDKYLDVTVSDPATSISSDGYSASVEGKISLADSEKSASRYWLAAVAYDAQGNVVAIRQLDKQSALAGSDSQSFTIYVYSIAGKIDHVAVFGEAAK